MDGLSEYGMSRERERELERERDRELERERDRVLERERERELREGEGNDDLTGGGLTSGVNLGGNSESDSNVMRSFMLSFTEAMRSLGSSGRSSGDTSSGELNRQVTALAPHKEGTDIAKYIRKLEADLSDLGCPGSRFKSILLQKLQSKAGTAFVASIDRDEISYTELKELLIEGLGSSKTMLGVKLIGVFKIQ